jgi:hypothetical protein
VTCFIKLSLFILAVFSPEIFSQNFNPPFDSSFINRQEPNSGAASSAGKSKKSDREKRGGVVISAYVGAAKTMNSSLTVSQPSLGNNLTFADVRFRSRSFEAPLYYGFRAGYFIPQIPFLGFEAEFIHLKVYTDPRQQVSVRGTRRGEPINRALPLGEIVQQYSVSHGANFLLFNVAARKGFKRDDDAPQGRVIFSARAGAGPTIPHTESRIENQFQEQYEISRPGGQIAGAAEIKLWRGVYALGEYKFTYSKQRGKIFSGTADSILRSHHGVFGLSYHF